MAQVKKADGRTKKRKTTRRNVANGIVHIKATFNNTHVSVSDEQGAMLSWSSGGKQGFKGSRKSTPFVAQVVAEDAISRAMEMGVKNVVVLVSGPGAGRETALRAVAKCGVKVLHIKDVTAIPHNGCRPPKRRRV